MRRDNCQQDLFIDAPIWYEGLTGRRRLFVEYYCTDRTCFLNATAAFVKAYHTPGKQLAESSIQSNSARLMRDPRIKDAIMRLLRARQNEEDQITEFQVLRLLKTLTFYNPADILDKYGNLKVKEDLSELGDLALCVTEIKRDRNGNREIKLYDRTRGLSMLAEYLDIVRPAESTTIVNPIVYLSDKDKADLRAGEDSAVEAEQSAEETEYEVMEI